MTAAGRTATAALAAVAITGTVVAFLVKGQIPDALTLIDTTLVGGYLGLQVPSRTND